MSGPRELFAQPTAGVRIKARTLPVSRVSDLIVYKGQITVTTDTGLSQYNSAADEMKPLLAKQKCTALFGLYDDRILTQGINRDASIFNPAEKKLDPVSADILIRSRKTGPDICLIDQQEFLTYSKPGAHIVHCFRTSDLKNSCSNINLKGQFSAAAFVQPNYVLIAENTGIVEIFKHHKNTFEKLAEMVFPDCRWPTIMAQGNQIAIATENSIWIGEFKEEKLVQQRKITLPKAVNVPRLVATEKNYFILFSEKSSEFYLGKWNSDELIPVKVTAPCKMIYALSPLPDQDLRLAILDTKNRAHEVAFKDLSTLFTKLVLDMGILIGADGVAKMVTDYLGMDIPGELAPSVATKGMFGGSKAILRSKVQEASLPGLRT